MAYYNALNFSAVEHNILHDKDKIINWTLQEQAPALVNDARPAKASQDDEGNPQ